MKIRTLTSVSLTSLVTFGLATQSDAAEWNLDNNGSWETNANWINPGTHPNGVDAVADFSKINITNHRDVTINGAITIGSLILGDTDGNREYRFRDGGGSLNFQVSSGNASITKTVGGADRIYVPITLTSDLDVNVTAGNVRIQDPTAIISGAGGINKTGAGQLTLGGNPSTTHTYTGTLKISEGRVGARNEANLGPGNIDLNGGELTYYWGASMNRSLGSGQNQIQFTGGTTGLSMNGNNGLTTNIGGGTTLVWGSTFFKPDTLLLQGEQTQNKANHRFLNPVDLNGADRTIKVSYNSAATYISNRAEMEGVISNSGAPGAGLIKVGNSKLQLERVNTYDGNTTISEGILSLTGSGSIDNSPEINVAAGATFDVSGKAGYTPAAGQKLTGAGTVTGAVTIASGSILAPGNSPGTTTYNTDQTWGGGGVYEWEIQDWTGAAGTATGWDLVDITDGIGVVDPSLSITATSGDPFVIEITEFSLTNFSKSAVLQTFEIARAEGGITGFDASDFTLDTTTWSQGGSWGIVQAGNSVNLTFIPEPSSSALLALGAVGFLIRRRRTA